MGIRNMQVRDQCRWGMLGVSALLSLGSALEANAGSPVTGTLAVSATITDNCAINATNTLAFGAYDPVVTNNGTTGVDLTGAGSLGIICTNGDSITVALDGGANGGSGTPTAPARHMASGGVLLAYNLFQPTSAGTGGAGTVTTTVWGGTGATFTYTATGAVDTVNVFGTVPKGQAIAQGTYNDTVNVTVNF